jgi:hypothetical protein
MEDSKAMTTPMSTTTTLDVDEEGKYVEQKEYQSMIGSLLYLMATRPDIQFSVCLCARFQASPRTSHRQAVKRIFRYLRHTPDFGLWYSASSSLALHGFSDADFAECRLDKKSTSGTVHGRLSYQSSYGFASGQIPLRSQGTCRAYSPGTHARKEEE